MTNIIETEKILASVIQKEMQLSNDEIWIYNQEFRIPNISTLFVVVQFQNARILSSKDTIQTTDSGTIEVQSIIQIESILVNVFSKDTSSRQRKHEVIFALNSVFSEQMQEKYGFRIFPIPHNFNNISRAEGATMLNRYGIAINVQRTYNKIIKSFNDYYDKFKIDVWDEPHLEENIPLIELEFPES